MDAFLARNKLKNTVTASKTNKKLTSKPQNKVENGGEKSKNP
jgi:hypothetical protein